MRYSYQKLLVSFLLTLITTQFTSGQTGLFKVKTNTYSVTVPISWDTIPNSIIEETMNMLSPDLTIEYDMGLYFYPNDNYFEYPYVLVQGISIPEMNQQSFSDFAKEVSKGQKTMYDDLGESVKHLDNIIETINTQGVIFDKEANKIYLFSVGDVANVGRIKSLTVYRPHGKGILAVHCYSKINEFAKFYPSFKIVYNNLAFDQPYNPEVSQKGIDWWLVLEKVVMGAAYGLMIGFVFWFWSRVGKIRKRRKSKRQSHGQ